MSQPLLEMAKGQDTVPEMGMQIEGTDMSQNQKIERCEPSFGTGCNKSSYTRAEKSTSRIKTE